MGHEKGTVFRTTRKNHKPKGEPLSRLWFLSQGCKQVPLEYVRGIVRWAHPDGYFLNEQGQKVMHCFSPTNQKGHTNGSCYPTMPSFGGKSCHSLMALAFYGERPIDTTTGKPCVCHHLIPDKRNYRPDNLLCWLTREQHAEADRRQRAMRKVTPEGDLYLFPYARLRQLQDPRVTSREEFEKELKAISACLAKLIQVDPLDAAAEERQKFAEY